MAKKTQIVAPIEIPGTQGGLIVRPWGEFDLNDAIPERQFFDCITSEHVGVHGTWVAIWKLDQRKSLVDPLYSEPIKRVYDGPYILKGWVEYPPTTPEATEDGWTEDRQISAWIARATWESLNASSVPSPGDIVQFWDRPIYSDAASLRDPVPIKSGLYFEAIDADEDGYHHDSPEFAGWTYALRRNTRFVPERKLYEESVAP